MKKETKINPYIRENGFPIYVAATLLEYAGNSLEQSIELAKEIHYHKNCFSPSFMEQVSMALRIVKNHPGLEEIPEEYKNSEERKILEQILKKIPIPFEFKPEVYA